MIQASRVLLVALVATLPPAKAAAQAGGRPCQIDFEGLTPGSRTTIVGDQYYFGGGFAAVCRGTLMRVSSDSAEIFRSNRTTILIGHAKYTEGPASLTADRIRYFEWNEWMEATGNVVLRNASATLTTPQLNYYRPRANIRPYATANAIGRSHLILRDSAAAPGADTTIIDADRFYMERDSLFYAGGTVVVTRPDLVAKADSMETDSRRQFGRLVGGPPHVEGRGTSTFVLDGNVLDIFGRERRISRVLAKGKATALSDSTTLRADSIDMRMSGGRIDSIAAWGPGRASATSPERDITAGRIDLSMPGQRLRTLFAVGRARAESRPDSTLRTKERDWIEGDTLTGGFEPRTPGDTTRMPALRTLVAWGNTRSFYQVRSQTAGDTLPALSYVTARQIFMSFASGEIDLVSARGDVRGLYGEPPPRDTTTVAGRVPPRVPPRR